MVFGAPFILLNNQAGFVPNPDESYGLLFLLLRFLFLRRRHGRARTPTWPA